MVRKQPKPELRPEDCHTDEQKWEYVHMLRKRWAAMGDKPSEILDFPMPDERWWTHPESGTPQGWKRICDDGRSCGPSHPTGGMVGAASIKHDGCGAAAVARGSSSGQRLPM
jgi:hypothetical protein